MFLLDTNVISELLLVEPDPRVVRWINRCRADEVATGSVCVFELEKGFGMLPAGRRRRTMQAALGEILAKDIGGGVLTLGEAGARAASLAWVAARSAGERCNHRDAMIAGTAAEHGAIMVSRNAKDFQHAGVPLIDPWEA